MILDRHAIRQAIARGDIVVSPFDDDSLRINSYDVHLSPILRTYKPQYGSDTKGLAIPLPLDSARDNPTEQHLIQAEGFVLVPGRLYLGATIEYTEAHGLVPWIDGKSSVGRLGLSVHVTAGRGDVGFCGHWTLELTVEEPLLVYAGSPVGQLTWMTVEHGTTNERATYGATLGSKYQQEGPGGVDPVSSRMHANFPLPEVWTARAEEIRARVKAGQ